MNNQVIVYKPYHMYRYVIPFFVILEIVLIWNIQELFVLGKWKDFCIWIVIILLGSVVILYCFYLSKITILFFEDFIVIKNIREINNFCKRYNEWKYAYYCQSYRHLTYLVFSDKPLKRTDLRKMANKNEIIEKIVVDDAIMIRINEWAKEEKSIKELIRCKFPDIEENG